MKKRNIFKVLLLSLSIFTACQQNNELTEIEPVSFEKNSIPDLTYVDGTPVNYTIVENEIIITYEPNTTEAEKETIRFNEGVISLGLVEVIPCTANPNAEIWIIREIIIHDFNFQHKVRIEADDDVERIEIGDGNGVTCNYNDQ